LDVFSGPVTAQSAALPLPFFVTRPGVRAGISRLGCDSDWEASSSSLDSPMFGMLRALPVTFAVWMGPRSWMGLLSELPIDLSSSDTERHSKCKNRSEMTTTIYAPADHHCQGPVAPSASNGTGNIGDWLLSRYRFQDSLVKSVSLRFGTRARESPTSLAQAWI